MGGQGITQIVFYCVALIALGYPLGLFMARVYSRERTDRVEGLVYRVLRVTTSPPIAASATSALPPPKCTMRLPCGASMAMPAPMAAATV